MCDEKIDALTDHSALCSSEAWIDERVSGPDLLQTKPFRQKGTVTMKLCWTEQNCQIWASLRHSLN